MKTPLEITWQEIVDRDKKIKEVELIGLTLHPAVCLALSVDYEKILIYLDSNDDEVRKEAFSDPLAIRERFSEPLLRQSVDKEALPRPQLTMDLEDIDTLCGGGNGFEACGMFENAIQEIALASEAKVKLIRVANRNQIDVHLVFGDIILHERTPWSFRDSACWPIRAI